MNKTITGARSVKGDLSTLNPNEQIFIRFVDTLNYYKTMEQYRCASLPLTTKIDSLNLNLTQINYEIILDPMSTATKMFTFWKVADEIYFFNRQGGDPTARNELFGPFAIKDSKVEFINLLA
jgi:hypothetical protein